MPNSIRQVISRVTVCLLFLFCFHESELHAQYTIQNRTKYNLQFALGVSVDNTVSGLGRNYIPDRNAYIASHGWINLPANGSYKVSQTTDSRGNKLRWEYILVGVMNSDRKWKFLEPNNNNENAYFAKSDRKFNIAAPVPQANSSRRLLVESKP